MKERPIIFNADMVRAVLDGRKTQTRRAVKFPFRDKNFGCELSGSELAGEVSARNYRNCPFGAVGDRLWVREAWQVIHDYPDEHGNIDERRYARSIPKKRGNYWHPVYAEAWGGEDRETRSFPWRPSIHMPRWASRITLEITGIRVERLQDISEQDAAAEGAATELSLIGDKHYLGYRSLWKSIYGDNSWQANPWVWVIEFKPAAGQTKGSSISSTSSEP